VLVPKRRFIASGSGDDHRRRSRRSCSFDGSAKREHYAFFHFSSGFIGNGALASITRAFDKHGVIHALWTNRKIEK
jgi:hypothetical protein